MIKNTALFYTCSLIEYIGRITKNERSRVVELLGKDVDRIYNYQDVFHCEPIEKVADDFIVRNNIPLGSFDNIASCKYTVPDYWDIGDVFARLVEDNFAQKDSISGIKEIFRSWLAAKISNYNSDLFYQSREYINACYKNGEILAA